MKWVDPTKNKILLIECIQQALIFITVFILAVYFSSLSTDPHHDGIMFKPALDVASGKVLFKETFTQYGALTTLIQAWAIHIFGSYLIVIKTTTAFFYGCLSLLLYNIWRKIMPTHLSVISLFLWIVLCPFLVAVAFPWSTIYALTFELMSVLALIRYLETDARKWIFLAGVLASLVFWCRQPIGVIYFLTIAAYFLSLISTRTIGSRNFLKCMAVFTVGWVSISLIFIIWIIKNNAFHDFWLQSIKFSLLFREAFGPKTLLNFITVFIPWPLNKWNGGYIWDVLPIVNLFIFVFVLWRIFYLKCKEVNIQILLLILTVSLSNWHLYYPFPDFMKSAWGSGIMVGLLTYFLWNIFPVKKYSIRMSAVLLSTALIYAYDLSIRLPSIFNYYKTSNIEVLKPEVLKGMRLNLEQYNHLTTFSEVLDTYLATHPSKKFINATTDALYVTFTDKGANYHPAYVKWTMLQYIIYPDYQKCLLDYVKKERPLMVVYLPPDIQTTKFENGIHSVFNGEESFGGYQILHEFKGGLNLIEPID